MSLYLLAKKAKMRDRARLVNSQTPFSLARTHTGSLKSKCSTSNISAPIVQTSYGVRNTLLTTTRCGCKVYKKMPDTTSAQYLNEKKGDHIFTANKNATTKTSSNINCSTSSSNANGKSLNSSVNRLKKCIVTKPPPVARTAGQQIEKIKAQIATCAAANPKPVANCICRTSV